VPPDDSLIDLQDQLEQVREQVRDKRFPSTAAAFPTASALTPVLPSHALGKVGLSARDVPPTPRFVTRALGVRDKGLGVRDQGLGIRV
jgi:hypothetical protein